jgi:hypothetical protein
MKNATLPPSSEVDDDPMEPELFDAKAEEEIHERDLTAMEAGLADLAAQLTEAQATGELILRNRFLEAERSLFATRVQKGAVLNHYHALYGPQRKWAAFLQVISMPRQTSYDLMGAATEAEIAEKQAGILEMCTDSVHSRPKEPRHRDDYDYETALNRAEVSVNRIFAGFPDAQKESLCAALADRLSAGGKTRLAPWPAPFGTNHRDPVHIS